MNAPTPKPSLHDVLIPEWKKDDPYFTRFEKTQNPFHKIGPGTQPWRVVDDVRTPAHKLPGTKDSLVAVHPDAIAIGSASGGNKEGVAFYVYFSWALAVLCYFLAYLSTPNDLSISDIFFAAFVWGGLLITFFSIWMWRAKYRSPPGLPILFNRKTRVVTFFRPGTLPFFKFWAPASLPPPVSCPWDGVHLRTYRALMNRLGRSFYYAFWMHLMWGGEDGDPHAVKDLVSIGYQGYEGDEDLFQLWEHIRLYMEEDGPPIRPGEKLRKPANDQPPLEFPPDIIAAAGGPALSEAEVLALAELRN